MDRKRTHGLADGAGARADKDVKPTGKSSRPLACPTDRGRFGSGLTVDAIVLAVAAWNGSVPSTLFRRESPRPGSGANPPG